MSDEITPALSAEQWAGYPKVLFRRDEDSGVELQPSGTIIVWTGSWAVYLEPFDRHALAAMSLHGQPFGFTQEDVKLLKRIAIHPSCFGEFQCECAWWKRLWFLVTFR